MSEPTEDRDAAPNVFPVLRYRDAPTAIRWLGAAFGFEPRLVVPGPNGSVRHAELGFGPGAVLLGSASGDDPPAVGAGIYVAVDDVDAHYERAVDAGATIERAIETTDYGAREYTARDPEGHVWSFGTYRPGTATTADQTPPT